MQYLAVLGIVPSKSDEPRLTLIDRTQYTIKLAKYRKPQSRLMMRLIVAVPRTAQISNPCSSHWKFPTN